MWLNMMVDLPVSVFWWPSQGPERTFICFRAGEQTDVVPAIDPAVTHYSLAALELVDISVSWI